MPFLTYVLIIGTILIVSVGAYSVSAVLSNPQTFAVGSSPYGISYEDWVSKWWQWNIQIPEDQHPISAHTMKCLVGDSGSGPVSFLTQDLEGTPEYHCMIPRGNAILVPIANGMCDEDEAKSSDPGVMIECATKGNVGLVIRTATVDGIPLYGLDKNEVKTGVFNVTVPVNNFADPDLTPGQWKARAGGYHMFLNPLSLGDHIIKISAEIINPKDPPSQYSYDAKFLIKVQ